MSEKVKIKKRKEMKKQAVVNKEVSKPNAGHSKKYIYFFGSGKADGTGEMKELLGGKGAGLAEMTRLGIPVPPGFTITTELCNLYYQNNLKVPKGFDGEMRAYLARVEKTIGSRFGHPENPLLVSVRSGSKFSMPGMLDTILNLGLNDQTVKGLAKKTKNERFAGDSYRRLIQMFGNVVLGIDKTEFEAIFQKKKEERQVKQDASLAVEDLKQIISAYKNLIKRKTGEEFPADPWTQLVQARDAVFKSWNNPRAITYRQLHGIPGHVGTAATIQAMVFGNLGEGSASGVGFSRNPSTGENVLYGEYLANAQGEDVVAGSRTPKPIAQLAKEIPPAYKQLHEIARRLERHNRDTQDFEFTIQAGKTFMLQTRTAKRTTHAAVRIAVDMVKEKLISKEEALRRIEPEQLNQLLHPRLDPEAEYRPLTKGLAASPGAAAGRVVFSAEEAVKRTRTGEAVILVRNETNPDDIHGMAAAVGILTARGGMTSHAAVVARGMGKCAVVGAEMIRVFEEKRYFSVGSTVVREKELVTLNGSKGEVIIGSVPTLDPEVTGEFAEFMRWADQTRTLGIRTNADTPADAAVAVKFGAEGIGLCRTEHMFFATDRLPVVQEMIVAAAREDRVKALQKLLPFQKADFKGIFEAMGGRPVTIRTLDPPLHEFLPRKEDLLAQIADLKAKQADPLLIDEKERILKRVEELAEFNPMLGHRGCRLGITYPEITEMQARAIFEAACELVRAGDEVKPEVMIPLVGEVREFLNQKEVVDRVAAETMKKYKVKLKYLVGTMIEVPRACVMAEEIARAADFFSFGTNDLTQMTFGFSRDDAGKFLTGYLEKGILPSDPFVHLDQKGVGQLIDQTVKKGKEVRKDLKVGICGEHGGDPQSIAFCHTLKLDYVSCSPYRVPIARLAAAQAALGAVNGLGTD